MHFIKKYEVLCTQGRQIPDVFLNLSLDVTNASKLVEPWNRKTYCFIRYSNSCCSIFFVLNFLRLMVDKVYLSVLGIKVSWPEVSERNTDKNSAACSSCFRFYSKTSVRKVIIKLRCLLYDIPWGLHCFKVFTKNLITNTILYSEKLFVFYLQFYTANRCCIPLFAFQRKFFPC